MTGSRRTTDPESRTAPPRTRSTGNLVVLPLPPSASGDPNEVPGVRLEATDMVDTRTALETDTAFRGGAALATGASIDAHTARSAEVFLRTSYATHMALHGMADNKSRMLIQMNGVVLSLLIAHESRLVPNADLDGSAIIALLCTSVLSMGMALLAARPPRRQGGVGRSAGDALNVIGRSDFATSEAGFEAAVDRFQSLVRDVHAIDRGLLRSLYRLGEMLEAKHRLLRLAYLTFGIGMAITAVILGLATVPIQL